MRLKKPRNSKVLKLDDNSHKYKVLSNTHTQMNKAKSLETFSFVAQLTKIFPAALSSILHPVGACTWISGRLTFRLFRASTWKKSKISHELIFWSKIRNWRSLYAHKPKRKCEFCFFTMHFYKKKPTILKARPISTTSS